MKTEMPIISTSTGLSIAAKPKNSFKMAFKKKMLKKNLTINVEDQDITQKKHNIKHIANSKKLPGISPFKRKTISHQLNNFKKGFVRPQGLPFRLIKLNNSQKVYTKESKISQDICDDVISQDMKVNVTKEISKKGSCISQQFSKTEDKPLMTQCIVSPKCKNHITTEEGNAIISSNFYTSTK